MKKTTKTKIRCGPVAMMHWFTPTLLIAGSSNAYSHDTVTQAKTPITGFTLPLRWMVLCTSSPLNRKQLLPPGMALIALLCVWMLSACGSNKGSGIDPFRPGADVSVAPQAEQSTPTTSPRVETQPVSPATPALFSAPRQTAQNVSAKGSAISDLNDVRIAVCLAWLLFIAFTQWLRRKAFAVSAAIQMLNVMMLGLLTVCTYAYQLSEVYWLTAIFFFSVSAFVWSCYRAILERRRGLVFVSDGLAKTCNAKTEGGTHELA